VRGPGELLGRELRDGASRALAELADVLGHLVADLRREEAEEVLELGDVEVVSHGGDRGAQLGPRQRLALGLLRGAS